LVNLVSFLVDLSLISLSVNCQLQPA